MSSYELTFSPLYKGIDPKTGRFMKGHVPANKGKRWDEFKSKRSQRRSSKGWKNLELYRHRPDTAGRAKKQVVAVMDNGRFYVLPCLKVANKWLRDNLGITGCWENIGRCCRLNASRKVCKHDWRKNEKKGSARVNTDHRYQGIRWYFENDDIWMEKIHSCTW